MRSRTCILLAAAGLATLGMGRPQPEPPSEEPVPAFQLIPLLPTQVPRQIEIRPPITVDRPPPSLPDPPEFSESMTRALELIRARQPRHEPFMPVEQQGLLAQLTSLSASINVTHQQWGRGGTRQLRSLNLGGAIYDLSGARAFRIVGTPRILEMIDENGVNLAANDTWGSYPDAGNPQTFTSPSNSPGSMLQQSFSFSSNDLPSLPSRIATLRVAVDVAVAGDSEGFLLRAQVSPDFTDLAPGVQARVTMMSTENGQTRLGVEYRLAKPTDELGRTWFVRAEVLDDEKQLLQSVETAQEAHTRDSIVGAIPVWGLDTRSAPAWYIRLYFVPSGQTVHFEIVENDLPLLGV